MPAWHLGTLKIIFTYRTFYTRSQHTFPAPAAIMLTDGRACGSAYAASAAIFSLHHELNVILLIDAVATANEAFWPTIFMQNFVKLFFKFTGMTSIFFLSLYLYKI